MRSIMYGAAGDFLKLYESGSALKRQHNSDSRKQKDSQAMISESSFAEMLSESIQGLSQNVSLQAQM